MSSLWRILVVSSLVLTAGGSVVLAEAQPPRQPRPITAAEREAIGLALGYLRGDAGAWFDRLAADAPLRALGREKALAELRVRLGPPGRAHWALRATGAGEPADEVVFEIEYPSGLDETVAVQMASSAQGWLVRSVACSVDPRLPQPLLGSQWVGEPASRAWPHGSLPAAMAIVLLAGLGWVVGRLLGRRVGFAAGAGLAVAAVVAACSGGGAGNTAPASQTSAVFELRSLEKLREALAGGTADREPLFAALPKSGPLAEVGRLWKASDLLTQFKLVEAGAILKTMPRPSPYPLTAILAARRAFLSGDGEAARQAYELARDQGIDHEGLRREAAEAYLLLGLDDDGEIALEQLSDMGSRLAESYYSTASFQVIAGRMEEGEKTVRTAWALEPLERAELFRSPALAALFARPSLFAQLEAQGTAEPQVAPPDSSRKPLSLPSGVVAVLSGELLSLGVGEAELRVPGGGELAPAGTPIEDARSRRERHEAGVLGRLPALLDAVQAPGALGQPALRRDLETAASALARGGRWDDLLRLTEPLAQTLERMRPGVVQLRALALKRTGRDQEARALLIRLAQRDIANHRPDPGTLAQLAELVAGEGEPELAVRLMRKAQALSPQSRFEQRVRQLAMEQRLAADRTVFETAHFSLRYPRLTGERYAHVLGGVLEQELRRIERWVPAGDGCPRVAVDLFPLEEFLRNYGGDVGVVGLYDGRVRVPFADLRSLHPVIVAVIGHELAHALIAQRSHDLAPHWVQEGVAQHIQMVEQSVNPFPELIKAQRQLSLPMVEAVLSGFSEPQFVEIAYAQAVWAVHFIETRWGSAAIARLIDAYGSGKRDDAALHAALGIDSAQFDHDLWAWAAKSAPLAWRMGLRRYDQEEAKSELRQGVADERRFRPAADDPGQRTSALRAWYAGYAPRAQPVKAALAPVVAAYAGHATGDVRSDCRRLVDAVSILLAKPAVLAAPIDEVSGALQTAYREIGDLGTACSSGHDTEARAHLARAERSLGAAARALSSWGYRP